MTSGSDTGARFVAALQTSPLTLKRWLATPRHPDAIGALIQQTLQLDARPTHQELRAMADDLDRSINAILTAAYHAGEETPSAAKTDLHAIGGAALKPRSTGNTFGMHHYDASGELHAIDGAALKPRSTGNVFGMHHYDASGELHAIDGAALKPRSTGNVFGMHHYDASGKTA